jgi:hypothetical protein
MIDTVLNMKRFLDGTLSAYHQSSVTMISVSQQRELQDKVRSAFRNGIGARQNAPAECIGGWRIGVNLTASEIPRHRHA